MLRWNAVHCVHHDRHRTKPKNYSSVISLAEKVLIFAASRCEMFEVRYVISLVTEFNVLTSQTHIWYLVRLFVWPLKYSN